MKEKKLSPNPVSTLSFDKIFLETDIAIGLIFKGNQTRLNFNFTKDVGPCYR